MHLFNRRWVTGCIILTLFWSGACTGISTPSLNITGNDNYYVWGTVENLDHPLHYILLLYGKHTNGRWYGPKTLDSDTFPGISPDRTWKCLYQVSATDEPVTAFRVYVAMKGITPNQVLVQGAQNLTLYYATIVAQTEADRR
ncbi:MAG: hypothetical protein LUQ50_09100 [Methanospirillum sp.]|uniref:hypothetical protein n=1 Tax=Methanospirillum sp. TaxID=45200 RepID=UPI002369FD11|nr:hypothetical protein [Methanospirillum sp.]MDD1729215.1 hypothetical protein [Methanospirillum sp.]